MQPIHPTYMIVRNTTLSFGCFSFPNFDSTELQEAPIEMK